MHDLDIAICKVEFDVVAISNDSLVSLWGCFTVLPCPLLFVADKYFSNPTVDAIAHRNINEPITPSTWNSRFNSFASKRKKRRVLAPPPKMIEATLLGLDSFHPCLHECIGVAGVVRRQAVDISPLRRVNQAIYLISIGAREAAFRNIKTIAECLADELINAAKGSSNSYAIKKKDEIERVAKANR
ncbi:hypothetical protein KIW84_061386 [Lathyrus oleraceus]|uniref:Small ribosomal subunit protein uS7 domain-containing protein n=1 Tax=Pisum sativum TaxID=3888 RepID=A0A9D5A6S1_PEA|nr:hypothetical protein KIW84_061386 [Pisum sativum]